MAKVVISEGQNIIDLCIQEYGGIQSLISFCKENNLEFTETLTPGSSVNIDTVNISRKQVVAYNKKNRIRANTGILVPTSDDGIFDDTFDETFQ